ncbi:MAG TPA: segregation/condensation protein A [Bacteroidia bacterium]|nr:segregation/condensation protein A [Bacteroidia bacterium]
MIINDSFEIKLPQFEGPFDLLLFFIERDELDIHNIPISQITNDFLEYMHKAEAMNMELASEFILVAATLMRIKAKMLLPRYEKDEQGNEIDPRQDLIKKLLEYRQYKAASEELKQKEMEREQMFERGNIQNELSKISLYADGSSYNGELNNLTLYKLMMTFEKVMERFRKNENEVKHTVVQYPFTVEDEQERIHTLIKSKPTIAFIDIFNHCKNRIHAVFTFLALLDLIQNRIVHIFLSSGFNNFFISSTESSPETAN